MTNTKNNDANNAISRERGGNRVGATPSNTAPSKCIVESFKPLRNGVDSLYLSFKGELLPEACKRLDELKTYAQVDHKEHLAQVQVEGHCFTVNDKGRTGFDFVLHDNCFEICLSTGAVKRPVAYVKVRSSYLASNTLQEVYNTLYGILNKLCYLENAGTISRVDLNLDFCVDKSFIDSITGMSAVFLAQCMRSYSVARGKLRGFDFGLGGDLSARLYDKTCQIQVKSGQDYLPLLWTQSGWVEGEKVWRLEFQIRRTPLSQFGITNIHDLQQGLESLWEYMTTHWLRIVTPHASDGTRSRWPTQPVWELIAKSYHAEGEQLRLKRVKKDSAPEEANVLVNLASSLISWMALRNITDVKHGLITFIGELPKLLQYNETRKGVPLLEHIKREVPKRIRTYQLRRNDDDLYSISNFDSLGGRHED